MTYLKMPEVMECINGYRNDKVQMSIKIDGNPVPHGSADYLKEYGYAKVSNLSHQFDLTDEPFETHIRRFLNTFLDLNLKFEKHISMYYCNGNLGFSPKTEEVDVIHQCLGSANIWIKTKDKQIHEVTLKEGDLVLVTSSVKIYRRKPNFFSRWADRFSTFESIYIQNIFSYGHNLPNEMGS